jgi:predicted MFS family arabinose efflux permease
VTSSPTLLTLLVMGAVPMLLGLSFQSYLPVFAKDVFGDGVDGNSTGLGLMMTMIGVGAIVGSLAVAATADYPRRTLLQIGAGLLFGASLMLFGVQQNFVFALLALVAVGFVSDYFAALNGTIIVSASDPAYYGRVMSINIMTFALMPLGTLPIGLLADAIGHVSIGGFDLIGVQVTTIGCGLIIATFMGAVGLFNRSYRHLDQSALKQSAHAATDRLVSGRSAAAVEDTTPVALS